MSPARLRNAALLGLAGALLCAGPALAHQKRSVRTANASARAVPGGVELDVMLVLRIAGDRARAFRARFDLDRSGRFEPAEAALAGDTLAPEAIGGFFVRFDGAAKAPVQARARARIAAEDAVEVAVLLSWPATAADVVQLASRPDRDRPGAPVIVARFSALPPLSIAETRPAPGSEPTGSELTGSEPTGPTPLLPGGDGLRVRLAARDPLPPVGAPAPTVAPPTTVEMAP